MEAIAFVLAVLLIIASRIISRQVDVIVELRKKYDHAQSEIRALVLQNLNMSQGVELSELAQELEAERKRLDWALKKQAYYARNPDRLWVDVGTGNHKWFAVNDDSPRATIDELIAGEPK